MFISPFIQPKELWRLILAVSLVLSSSHGFSADVPVSKAQQEGLLLATDARSRIPVEAAEHTGKLKLRDAEGKRSEIPVTLKVTT